MTSSTETISGTEKIADKRAIQKIYWKENPVYSLFPHLDIYYCRRSRNAWLLSHHSHRGLFNNWAWSISKCRNDRRDCCLELETTTNFNGHFSRNRTCNCRHDDAGHFKKPPCEPIYAGNRIGRGIWCGSCHPFRCGYYRG